MCPPVEIPQSSAKDFEDEAQVTAEITDELRRKFREATSEDTMRLVHFKALLLRYGCCREEDCQKYFRAFDRDSDERLSFAEFARGSIAADPSCPHVLNSFTGYERSRYAFDFFAKERHEPAKAGKNSVGNMEYAEFLRLLAACAGRPRNGLQSLDLSGDAKVSQLGLMKSVDGEKRFVGLPFKLYYSMVSGEKLRGTSRLFRFHHGLLPSMKARGSKTERAPRRSRRGVPVSAEADSDEDEATVELLLTHGVKLTPLHDDHVWIFSDR